MKVENIFAIIVSFIGLYLIYDASNAQVVAGLFLALWGNNIVQGDKR